ncbi:MAG TPA: hypothetical protein VML96_09110, partial [Egibacteraceae bacterium]|nr:hypothetical protein [Egibacteraceae bacterium]
AGERQEATVGEGLRDLPVSVELAGALGQEVAAWVEIEAGWQLVSGDGGLPPALVLADAARPGAPCVVVTDGQPTAAQIRDAMLDGAIDVVGWPDDRQRLIDAPLRARPRERRRDGPSLVRVAGAAGGAGASSLALAIGGLAAWSGHRALVIGGDDLLALCGLAPWSGPGAAEVAAQPPADAAAEIDALSRPVPSVPGLRILGGAGHDIADVSEWPVDAVVADLRTVSSNSPPGLAIADLVVARPDVGLRAAAGLPGRPPVIVMGQGPLDRSGARRALGRAPCAWLPSSTRVARAALAGRVPAGLPGSWLAALRRALLRAGS